MLPRGAGVGWAARLGRRKGEGDPFVFALLDGVKESVEVGGAQELLFRDLEEGRGEWREGGVCIT